MKKIILSAIAIAFAIAMPANAQDGLLKKYAQRLSTPRHYICYRTNENIKIDGKLNEKSWAKAADTESFVDISGDGFPKPIYDTKARLMWDDNYLYVSAVMEEPNIVANLTQRDTIIYHDNDFEVFLDPTGDGQNYFEIENNARGVIFDLMLDRAYRRVARRHSQQAQGQGPLMDCGDGYSPQGYHPQLHQPSAGWQHLATELLARAMAQEGRTRRELGVDSYRRNQHACPQPVGIPAVLRQGCWHRHRGVPLSIQHGSLQSALGYVLRTARQARQGRLLRQFDSSTRRDQQRPRHSS